MRGRVILALVALAASLLLLEGALRLRQRIKYGGAASTLIVLALDPRSKWNKIEHRMFCHISENWWGRPLISHEVIVNLIANTTTEKGLKVQSELGKVQHPRGIKVSDEELAAVRLRPSRFQGDWNYFVAPKSPSIRHVIS